MTQENQKDLDVDVVRILLVNGSHPIEEDAFEGANINVEFVRAHSLLDAMKQLDDWSKQGISADIVDVEEYPRYSVDGKLSEAEKRHYEVFKRVYCPNDDRIRCENAIALFRNWSDKRSSDSKKIGKFLINTLYPRDYSDEDVSTKLGVPVGVHHPFEYDSIRSYHKFGSGDISGINKSRLCEHLNEKFGTNYPTKDNVSEDNTLSF
jgi:hypothetical protein